MFTGTNLKHTKAYNARIVLDTIRRHGPLSRASIARRTELTAQTVSNIARELLESGLIRDAGLLREGRGAPATRLALNAEGAFSIGLDLNKDHLTGLLVDFVGEVRQRIHHELDFPLPAEALDLLTSTTRALVELEGISLDRVWGIGVGLPGPLGISGDGVVSNVASPTNFPGWKNVPVADELERRLSLPVHLEKNATAAAIGERWYGEGQHAQTFFYVFFGAGLGGGLIIDGHPYEGFTGNAGELGYCYLPDPEATFAEGSPQRPHLGVYFALPQLYRRLRAHGTQISRPEQLADLLEDEHPVLLEWLDAGLRHLAPVVLAIEYLLDPEAIFFGGRLPESVLSRLVERLRAALAALRIEERPSAPALRLATAGADAAALGVATLPMYASLAPGPHVLLKSNGLEGASEFSSPESRLFAS